MKFALQGGCSTDHEAQTVIVFCAVNQLPYKIYNNSKDVPEDCVPVGTVQWIQDVLGKNIVPDYYPDFLRPYLHRKIWKEEKWPYGHKVFIKPADRHKRFTGFTTHGNWKGKKKSPYWCSEIVKFVSEWRWYIADGEVIDARWGSGEELPVPKLDVIWPKGYYAAADFGLLDDGRIALVESNSPFACGWYGPTGEGKTYIDWLTKSWYYLKNKA